MIKIEENEPKKESNVKEKPKSKPQVKKNEDLKGLKSKEGSKTKEVIKGKEGTKEGLKTDDESKPKAALCPICGIQSSNQRTMTNHIRRDHNK